MKKQVILFGMALSLSFGLLSCENIHDKVRNQDLVIKSEDVQKFKTDLESLNKTNDISVKVNDSSRIVYAKEADILNLENGIVLFGWPSCPWFRNAVEPLLEFSAAEKATIYYLNIKEIRDKKEIKGGKIVELEKGSAGYLAILKKFHGILNPYKHLGVDSIKRISSPTVLFIEKGKAVFKVASTVHSQTDPHIKLTAGQQGELRSRYLAYFKQEKEEL